MYGAEAGGGRGGVRVAQDACQRDVPRADSNPPPARLAALPGPTHALCAEAPDGYPGCQQAPPRQALKLGCRACSRQVESGLIVLPPSWPVGWQRVYLETIEREVQRLDIVWPGGHGA